MSVRPGHKVAEMETRQKNKKTHDGVNVHTHRHRNQG